MPDGRKGFPLNDGGAIAFRVSTEPSMQRATYNITVVRRTVNVANGGTRFVLRWPGVLREQPAAVGCTVVQVEPGNGLVVVVPIWATGSGAISAFIVSNRWK